MMKSKNPPFFKGGRWPAQSLAMDAEPRWGSAVINPNKVVHRQNPLVFFVTFVVNFRVPRPSLEAEN